MSYRRKMAKRIIRQEGDCSGVHCTKHKVMSETKHNRGPCCTVDGCISGYFCAPKKEARKNALKIASKWLKNHPKKDKGQSPKEV
jgi:hypothetical protein